MRTQGSLLPPSPSPHLWAPASVPIENGDHSSLNQLPPSSPQIPSILFGDCKHLETGLTHTCRVLCWGYKILLLIVAQQKSESSRTWFIAWWFLPNPHQRFENIRLQREYNLSKIMKALFLSSYNIKCFFFSCQSSFLVLHYFFSLQQQAFANNNHWRPWKLVSQNVLNLSLWRKKRYAELATFFQSARMACAYRFPDGKAKAWFLAWTLCNIDKDVFLWNTFKMAVR